MRRKPVRTLSWTMKGIGVIQPNGIVREIDVEITIDINGLGMELAGRADKKKPMMATALNGTIRAKIVDSRDLGILDP